MKELLENRESNMGFPACKVGANEGLINARVKVDIKGFDLL